MFVQKYYQFQSLSFFRKDNIVLDDVHTAAGREPYRGYPADEPRVALQLSKCHSFTSSNSVSLRSVCPLRYFPLNTYTIDTV